MDNVNTETAAVDP